MSSLNEPVVYLGEKFVPASEAHVAIYDLGIVLGATVTDFLRTFRQHAYRLEDHVHRFYESCKYARIDPPITAKETTEVTGELIRKNASLLPPEGELGVIYFITPGINTVYAGSAGGSAQLKPTYCIHSFPMPFRVFEHFFTQGLHAVTPSIRHVPPQCVDPKIKNRSRLHFWLAEQEAHLMDASAVPLLLDLDGNLTETSGANFLLVKNGAVLSPSRRNILQGISRKVVQELCGKLDIPFLEKDLQVFDAITADEAFLATSPVCMAPIVRFNGATVGDGKPGGPIFERILAAWSAEVGVNIREQVLEGAKREQIAASAT